MRVSSRFSTERCDNSRRSNHILESAMSESEDFDQIRFACNDFAMNAEPRCPCLLLLDVSGSMNGKPIDELNAGLDQFRDELAGDSLAMRRVEVGIVTFGPIETVTPFTAAAAFSAPHLQARGDTPMGAAILQGLEMLEARKAEYKANGVPFYRPWVFLITDGAPTDEWKRAADKIREGEDGKKFAFFAVGVEGARMDILQELSVREPLKLYGLRFRELFQWLSASMKSVSQSALGTEVKLTSPAGWASV